MNTAVAETTKKPAIDADFETPSPVELASQLLGGSRVLRREVTSDEDAHDLVMHGIPAEAMAKLFAGVVTLSPALVREAIGVSERSFARRKAARKTRLPVAEGDRLWRFAEILAHATRIFGSQAAAERWLERPAISLDRRKPLDLLRTQPGARLVALYLGRIEDGVYT